MDSHPRKRKRPNVAAHQWSFDSRGYPRSRNDYIEMEGLAAFEGYPAKIWYVVRIPAFNVCRAVACICTCTQTHLTVLND